jgi:hypothetical protein
MMRGFAYTSTVTLLAGAALGQSGETLPAFEIADVHAGGRHITSIGSVLPAVLCFSCVSLYLRARVQQPSEASITLERRQSRFFTGQPAVRPSFEKARQIVQQGSADSPLGKNESRKGAAHGTKT